MSDRVNIIPLIEPISVFNISQNDVGRRIGFELYEGLQSYRLGSSDEAFIHIELPNGRFIMRELENNRNIVTLTIDEELSAIAGRCYAKINIRPYNSDDSIGSSLIYIDVEQAP